MGTEETTETVDTAAEAVVPEQAQQQQHAQASDGRGEMVMQIDMAGDAKTIAEEEVRASLKGLRIVRINDAKKEATEQSTAAAVAKEPVAAGTAEGEKPTDTASHPLRDLLLGKETKAAPLKVTAPVRDYFEKNNLGDPDQVLAELPTLRKSNADLVAENQKMKGDLEYISKLSPAALNAIQKDLAGENWQEEYSKTPHFDWRKNADQQDPEALYKVYGKPGEISEDDWTEYKDKDGDPRAKAYVQAKLDLCAMKYGADQDKEVNYLTRQDEAQKEAVATRAKTTDAAMAHLFSTVPGSEAHAETIKKLLSPKAILAEFYEDPDTCTRLRLDGPLNAWLVKDKATVLGAKVQRAQREAKDSATLDVMRRTPEKRDAARRGSGGTQTGKSGQDAAREYLKRAWGL